MSHFPSCFLSRFFFVRKREHNLGEPFSTRGGVFIFLLGWRALALLFPPPPFWGCFRVFNAASSSHNSERVNALTVGGGETSALHPICFPFILRGALSLLPFFARCMAINFPRGGKSIKRQSDAGQRKRDSGQRRFLENCYLFAGVLAVPQLSRRSGKNCENLWHHTHSAARALKWLSRKGSPPPSLC